MTANPFLLYRDGDNRERVLSLHPGMAQASVGRSTSSDLALSWDRQVSRDHARLERVGDGWAVVDDGMSSNGTFVNGRRVAGRHQLSDGDAMQFGTTTVTYRAASEVEEDPTDPRGAAPDVVDLSTTQRRVLEALCRPFEGGQRFANPPSDQEIADELFLAPGAVRTHLAVLVAKCGLDELPDDQKRIRLAEAAIQYGVV